jgi:hypothetical protein
MSKKKKFIFLEKSYILPKGFFFFFKIKIKEGFPIFSVEKGKEKER